MSNSMQRVYLGLALALATASWASAQEIPATTIPEQLPQSASQKRESAKPPSFSPGDPMPDREPKPDAAGKKGTDVRKIDEPEPLQQSPHNIDPEVLTDLNPIFLEVADAAILEDSSKLKRCAEKLDAFAEKSPAHRVAVGMAQLVICDLIPARESYISQSARICSWERLDPAQAENIALRFAMFRMQLLQSDHADWDPAVIRECQKHLWPGPDQLTAAISRAYVQLLDSYEEKAAFLQGMRDKAQQFTITINPTGKLESAWSEGRQDLARMLIELYVDHVRLEEMWSAVRAYLDEFGDEGKHSPQVFGLAMSTLVRAKADEMYQGTVDAPDVSWLRLWHQKLAGRGKTEAVNRRISESWERLSKWMDEPLPLGRMLIGHLNRDPKLRVTFNSEFSQPTLQTVFEQIFKDTGVSLRVGPATEPDLFIASAAKFSGPLHSAMRIIAELKTIQGEWERTTDGYVLHSSQKNPPGGMLEIATKSSTARLVLIAVNLVVVGLVVRWLLSRRRMVAASSADRRSSSSSGNKTP